MLLGATNIANLFQSQAPSPAPPGPPVPPVPGTGPSEERRPSHDDIQVTRTLGHRHATRSRTRTRSRVHLRGAYERGAHAPAGWSRYSPEEHPLAPHNLAKRGYHTFTCLRVPFHVNKRYSFVRELGVGAYGCVALAHDSETDQEVAIKKVANVFGREVLTRRALREVATLECLVGCSNVTELLDFDTSFVEFSEIYLVLRASDADLSQIIRSNQTLTEAHIKYFMVQLLRAIHYMHSIHILHRDLKPGNLLVNADCTLRVCDFGMARAFSCQPCEHSAISKVKDHQGCRLSDSTESPDSAGSQNSDTSLDVRNECAGQSSPRTLEINGSRPPSPYGASSRQVSSRFPSPSVAEDEDPMLQQIDTSGPIQFPGGPLTEYVATRWYRAPEVMLCFRGGYGPAMDMWSVGCIFAELLGGKPLFPGKDYMDQLALIRNVLGSPSSPVIEKIGSQKAKEHMESLPPCEKQSWSSLFPDAPEPAIDLLSRILHWDPSKRISAGEALAHPWLKRYRQASFSVKFPEPFSRFYDVELIRTPGEFKEALERESALVRETQAARKAESDKLAESAMSEDEQKSTGRSDQEMAHPPFATSTSPKHEWGAHTRPSSSQSGSTCEPSLGMQPYDWTPPSSFDSEPGMPVHLDHDESAAKHVQAPPLPDHQPAERVRNEHIVTPPEETPDQKKVQRKKSSEFSILNRARALMSWT